MYYGENIGFQTKKLLTLGTEEAGVIIDMEFDLKSGRIVAIVVPGPSRCSALLRAPGYYNSLGEY